MSGSGGDEFLLKWNDHHNSFFNIMQELCANEVLTDVTLACGGRVFETHKIMLCVCSAFFRQVLTRQTDKHPIVFLKDIRPKHLEQLLQYMYNGEINVLQVRPFRYFDSNPFQIYEYVSSFCCCVYVQSPAVKFKFAFVPLQMLRFSALCGQIWQTFWGTYDLRTI